MREVFGDTLQETVKRVLIKRDTDKWAEVIRAAAVKAE
jgi:hypothetical protein